MKLIPKLQKGKRLYRNRRKITVTTKDSNQQATFVSPIQQAQDQMKAIAPRTLLEDDPLALENLEKVFRGLSSQVQKGMMDEYYRRFIGKPDEAKAWLQQQITDNGVPSVNDGKAIYLHYPNFMGKSTNAFKIGNWDVGGTIFGEDAQLPVGHAAGILIDPKNNTSTYYEYGRYPGTGFGHVRPTTKGGNWRRISLPSPKEGENDSTYVARIQHLLPDTNTGAYQAVSVPYVDVNAATQYINDQANDPNREEYSISNTCASGICKAIFPFQKKLGIPESSSERRNNEGGYSSGAKRWSNIPGSTGWYAKLARDKGSNVYIMNNSNKE